MGNSAFRAFKTNPTPKLERKWKKENRKAKKIVRKAKSAAVKSAFDDVIDIHSFWKTVLRKLGGNNKSELPEISDDTDNRTLTTDQEKCEALSVHFYASFSAPTEHWGSID